MHKSFPNQYGCIDTFSGVTFNYNDVTPESINLADIAKGLSNEPHFRGQTFYHFSVAQHSLLVLYIAEWTGTISPEMRLAILLHDASEAYTGNIPKPLKVMLPDYVKIENNIQEVIFKKFGLDTFMMPEIKRFDISAQTYEYDLFFNNIVEEKMLHIMREIPPAEMFEIFLDALQHACDCLDYQKTGH